MYIRVSRFTEIFDSLDETLDWYVFCCGEHESRIQKIKKKFVRSVHLKILESPALQKFSILLMRRWIGTCFAVVNTNPESKKLKNNCKVSSLENTGKWQFFSYKKFEKKFQCYKIHVRS